MDKIRIVKVWILLMVTFGIVNGQTKTEINNVIFNAGTFSEPKQNSQDIVKEKDVIEGSKKCHIKTIKLVKRFEDYITFSDNSDLYPGAIIQGKYLNDGKIISIGSFKRQPLTITVSGLDLGEGKNTKKVNNPNKATITEAVNDMLRGFNGSSSSKFTFKKVEAYSKGQALLELGLKVNWLAGSVGGNLELKSEEENHSIFIYFKQSYYSISTEAPPSPASFFSTEIDVEDLKYRINKENPAGYVSSVTYGRILVAKMTSSSSIEEMKAAVNAKFAFGAVEVSAGVQNDKLLSKSTFEVYSSGGLISYVPTDINGVVDFIQTGLKFEVTNQAVPIAYEVKYLKDNSPFMVGDETTYSIRDCKDNTQYQDFEIYLYGFNVIDDCENSMMAPGEFYFNIQVNDLVVYDLSAKNHKDGYSNDWIYLKKTKIISVPNTPEGSITVKGWVKEHDDYGDSEILGDFQINHNYPFSQNDLYNHKDKSNGSLWYKKLIEKSHHCRVYLYYQIRKK